MSYEQELQQSRELVDNFNQLDDETRSKLANGVEWLAFLQNMASTPDEREQSAPTDAPAA
ncbi:MAG: hypothetical protein IKP64_02425 [Selenomonadaceae bacterium]|nr:hypothetical protein [Selenomonadaceae bacterium]